MCRFKSGIILKDRVFIPDYDSHEDMLGELKIEDTEDNAKRLFVRAELVPPNDDVFAPVSEWEYHVDQDILPEWYVAEVDEKRMRDAVTEWAKEHIHVGEKIKEITSGLHYIMDGTVGVIGGSAEISELCGSAKVGYVNGSAKVEKVCGSAKVGYVYGSATVMTSGIFKWDNADGVCIKDKAVLLDRYNKKIYHAGAFETVIAGGRKDE